MFAKDNQFGGVVVEVDGYIDAVKLVMEKFLARCQKVAGRTGVVAQKT